MRSRIVLGLNTIVFALFQVSANVQQRPVNIDDVVHMKRVHLGPQISPDGRRVLFLLEDWSWGARSPGSEGPAPVRGYHIWIVGTDGTAPARQLTFGDGEFSPRWSPDGRYISFLASRSGKGLSNGSQVWLLPADGGEAWPLTDIKGGVGEYVWSPDSRHLAFTAAAPSARDDRNVGRDATVVGTLRAPIHVWTFAVGSRVVQQVTDGVEFTVTGGLQWSPDAMRIVFATAPSTSPHDVRRDLRMVTVQTKAAESIATTDAMEQVPSWSPDGRTIAFWAMAGSPIMSSDGIPAWSYHDQHLMLYDVQARRSRDVYDPAFASISAQTLHWTPDSKSILFDLGHRGVREIVSYELPSGKYRKLTAKNGALHLGSFSQTSPPVAAVTFQSPTAPSDVYVADANFGSFKRLTDMNPQTRNFALGETETVRWTSRDGWDVEGFLIKPVNYVRGKRYPLLVRVHGGPTGAYGAKFEAEDAQSAAQLWAGRGWAVLLPNPRGSVGYGERFMRGNFKDWGGGDYQDIMAGVDALITRGIADEHRLAISGHSFGGYMTAWAITQTPRFKAACVSAGMSNLRAMYAIPNQSSRYLGYFGGPPTSTARRLYEERSPVNYAERVSTPVLIIHGATDPLVPVSQAYELYQALKDLDKPVELVVYPREAHSLTEYEHQRDGLQREYDWIALHTLGAAPRTNLQP